MIFRRIILSALLVGVLSGFLLSAIQQFGVLPAIETAEIFEASGVPATTHDQAHGHADDGAEHQRWTIVANILTAIGFALLLIPAMSIWEHLNQKPLASSRNGLLWGAAAYLCLFVLPAIGLPPEIPGAAVAELGQRQQWWLLTVACGVGGLSGVAFLRSPLCWAAVLLIGVPFLIGAPHLSTGAFDSFRPEIATQMETLAHRYVWVTALTNAVYWLTLGALAGWAVARWIRPALDQADSALTFV
ncbi:MAG TPA: CbtA family protein [Rugosibacter sp.]